MKPLVLEFWRQRLEEGKIFFNRDVAISGYEFRILKGGSPEWPDRVAKESLYNNFLAWCHSRSITPAFASISEFYRHLEPLAAPMGKKWHNSRHRIQVVKYHLDTSAKVDAQRAFFRLVPIEVAKAWLNIATARGTVSHREEWKAAVRAYATSVGASVASLPHG